MPSLWPLCVLLCSSSLSRPLASTMFFSLSSQPLWQCLASRRVRSTASSPCASVVLSPSLLALGPSILQLWISQMKYIRPECCQSCQPTPTRPILHRKSACEHTPSVTFGKILPHTLDCRARGIGRERALDCREKDGQRERETEREREAEREREIDHLRYVGVSFPL